MNSDAFSKPVPRCHEPHRCAAATLDRRVPRVTTPRSAKPFASRSSVGPDAEGSRALQPWTGPFLQRGADDLQRSHPFVPCLA